MTDEREKLIEEAVAQAISESDDRNHEDLCHCGLWPSSCVTYGDRKPWSRDAESVARAALAVFEKAHTPTGSTDLTGDAHKVTPTDDERSVIEKIKLAGHLAAQVMVFQGDTYPVKAIPYTSFLHIIDGFRRSEPQGPSAEGREHTSTCDAWADMSGSGCTCHVEQGEPFEAQGIIARALMDSARMDSFNAWELASDLLAALRAAGEVTR